MSVRASRRLAALAAAGLLAACQGVDYWSEKVRMDPLHRLAEDVRNSPSCSALVPMEFGRTFPIPVRAGADEFKVLYYPLFVSPGKSEALTPTIAAGFARGASPAHCEKLAGSKPLPAGAPVPAGLSVKAYYRAEAALYYSLDKTAAAYRAGGAPSAADKQTFVNFADAFTTLAEPGLLPDYYRANPDFWEWLRAQAGRSIPKP